MYSIGDIRIYTPLRKNLMSPTIVVGAAKPSYEKVPLIVIWRKVSGLAQW